MPHAVYRPRPLPPWRPRTLAERIGDWFRTRAFALIALIETSFVIAGSVAWAIAQPSDGGNFDFVAAHSHRILPDGATDLDSAEQPWIGAAFAFAQLPPGTGSTVARREHFTACDVARHAWNERMFLLEQLRPDHRELPWRSLVCLEGQWGHCVQWTYFLDVRTDRLWLNVDFPDPGGTPRCDGDPPRPGAPY